MYNPPGLETCPLALYSDNEVHISADVSLMMKQYWQLTRDLDFMVNRSGAEVVRQTAKFWASRATYNTDSDTYSINRELFISFMMYMHKILYTNVVRYHNRTCVYRIH